MPYDRQAFKVQWDDRTWFVPTDPSAVVSIVIPMKGKPDKFLVTIGPQLAEMTWDGEAPTPKNIRILTSVDKEPGKEGTRFNDGKADPYG